MKKLFAIIFIIFFSASSHAQYSYLDSSLTIRPAWYKFYTKKLIITEDKIRIKKEDTLVRSAFSYEVELQVKDSTANGFIISWDRYNYVVNTTDPVANKITTLMFDFPFLVLTDRDGKYKSLENYTQIRDTAYARLARIETEFSTEGDLSKMIAKYRKQFDSPQEVMTFSGNDIRKFLYLNGREIFLKSAKKKIKIPNPYNQAIIDASSETSLFQMDTANQSVVARMLLSYDKKQLTDASYQVYKNSSGNTQNISRESLPDILLTEKYLYSAYLINGNFRHLLYEQRSEVGTSKNVDSMEIEFK